MQTCAHCTSEVDYALHVLPCPAIVLACGGRARLSDGAWYGVQVTAHIEAYWACMVQVRIPSRPKHNGDTPDDIIMVQ